MSKRKIVIRSLASKKSEILKKYTDYVEPSEEIISEFEIEVEETSDLYKNLCSDSNVMYWGFIDDPDKDTEYKPEDYPVEPSEKRQLGTDVKDVIWVLHLYKNSIASQAGLYPTNQDTPEDIWDTVVKTFCTIEDINYMSLPIIPEQLMKDLIKWISIGKSKFLFELQNRAVKVGSELRNSVGGMCYVSTEEFIKNVVNYSEK